jgi:hypothetical protein
MTLIKLASLEINKLRYYYTTHLDLINAKVEKPKVSSIFFFSLNPS